MALTRRKLISAIGVAIAAFALALAFAPSALAASVSDPDITVSSYNENSATVDDDNMQHAVVTIDYGATVAIGDVEAVMDGLTVKIAGYDITAANYYRPVEATAVGNTLVLDIGNVYSIDEVTGALGAPAFTAQYGGVIEISGTPTGVTAGGAVVGAISAYKTVIPTGVHFTQTNEGTSSVTATVDATANVRGMYHVIVYSKTTVENADGSVTATYTPVNKNGTTSGNLGVGAATSHAHMFMSMTAAQLASGSASALSGVMPDGYSVSAAAGNQFTVSGPSGSSLYVHVFDDVMLNGFGWDFNGIVSTEGIGEYEEFLPDAE